MVDQPPAVQDDHAGGEVADQLDPGHEHREQPERALVGHAVLAADVLEDVLVAPLAAVALDGADTGHRLHEVDDDQGGALADGAVGRLRGIAEPPHEQQQGGEAHQARQAQLEVEGQQQDRRADEGERRGDQPVEAVAEQLLDRLDVVGHPADDAPGGVAVVEGDVQALEVAEQPAAQVQQDLLADAPGHLQEHHAADRLQHHGAQEHAEHPHQGVGAATGQQRRHARVDADLHEPGHGQPGGVLQQHHDGQQQDETPVRREQAAQQPPAAGLQAQADGLGDVVGVLGGDTPPRPLGTSRRVELVVDRARGAGAGGRGCAHREASAISSSAASRER